jgi:hypothetical protein
VPLSIIDELITSIFFRAKGLEAPVFTEAKTQGFGSFTAQNLIT